MGLDMWAVIVSPWEVDYDKSITEGHKKWKGIDTTKTRYVRGFASWRKHNRLHGWMNQLWIEKGKPLSSDEESSVSDKNKSEIIGLHNGERQTLHAISSSDDLINVSKLAKEIEAGDLADGRMKEIMKSIKSQAESVTPDDITKSNPHSELNQNDCLSFKQYWNMSWSDKWSSSRFKKPYVRFFEDVPFNMITLDLTKDDLLNLKDSIQNKTLPITDGFFFGADSYHDDYLNSSYENLDTNQGYDLEFVENSLRAVEHGLKVVYDSWW